MADTRFRIAERSWLSEGTRDAWVTYLREARRVGNPVFTTYNVMVDAIDWANETGPRRGTFLAENTHTRFEPTEDGFITRVIRATNPPIERVYQFPISPDDYDEDSFPIWSWWTGDVIVRWDNDFGIRGCPALGIKVETCDVSEDIGDGYPDFYDASSLNIIGEHLYEGGCVTNEEELSAALKDWDNWLFSE